MSKGVQIAIGAALVAGLLGWYASANLRSLGGTFRYYQTLKEFEQHGASGEARVHGYVEPGSIVRDVKLKQIRFDVQNAPPHSGAVASDPLPVVYAGLEVPDMFKDGAEVVVEGRLAGSGPKAVFYADNVLAKCPSKFKPKRTEPASF